MMTSAVPASQATTLMSRRRREGSWNGRTGDGSAAISVICTWEFRAQPILAALQPTKHHPIGVNFGTPSLRMRRSKKSSAMTMPTAGSTNT